MSRQFEGIIYCHGCGKRLGVTVEDDDSWSYDHPIPTCPEWELEETQGPQGENRRSAGASHGARKLQNG